MKLMKSRQKITYNEAVNYLYPPERVSGLFWDLKIFRYYLLEENELILARKNISDDFLSFDISVFLYQSISDKWKEDIKNTYLNVSTSYDKNILSHNISDLICIKCGTEVKNNYTDHIIMLDVERINCEAAIMQKVLG